MFEKTTIANVFFKILVDDATRKEIDQKRNYLIYLNVTSALIVCRLFMELLTINFHSLI